MYMIVHSCACTSGVIAVLCCFPEQHIQLNVRLSIMFIIISRRNNIEGHIPHLNHPTEPSQKKLRILLIPPEPMAHVPNLRQNPRQISLPASQMQLLPSHRPHLLKRVGVCWLDAHKPRDTQQAFESAAAKGHNVQGELHEPELEPGLGVWQYSEVSAAEFVVVYLWGVWVIRVHVVEGLHFGELFDVV